MKVLFILTIIFVANCHAEKVPEVKIKLGKIQGYVRKSFKGEKYAAFEGIPYAKPPLGNLRFKVSEPNEPWNGIWNATVPYTCIQYVKREVIGNEDCLYLNVYVPLKKLKSSEKLDVIAYIHGGAFMIGSGTFIISPEMLMDRNVVFVTFNYRLGPFGFLSTGDKDLPGNLGLKDQVLALKWIQKYISNFRGNPNSVMLTGTSAGGASVSLHMFSPLSKGLFHRAYSESGTALNPWVIHSKPNEQFHKLAKLSGCNLEKQKDIIECLRTRPAAFLSKQMANFYAVGMSPFSPFAAVIEDKDLVNSFLPKHPILCQKGNIIDVPMMISTTTLEGIFPGVFLLPNIETLEKDWVKIAPYVVNYNHSMAEKKWESAALKVQEQYVGKNKFNKDTFHELLLMLTDRHFVHGAEQTARYISKINESPTYYFVFNHDSDLMVPLWNYKGIAHGLTNKFFYGYKSDKFSKADLKLIPKMLDMFTSFAKTGVPQIADVEWEPVKTDKTINYLNITSPNDIKEETKGELTQIHTSFFWNSFYFMENKDLTQKKKKEEL